MRNIIYLGYFITSTNYADLKQSLTCVVKKGYSKYKLLADMVLSSILYGSSFVDYFNFQFYRKGKKERKAYATMGIMYKFHKKVNDQQYIQRIDDKQEFFKNFTKFCNKPYLFTKTQSQELILVLQQKDQKKIVIKDPVSTGGKGVRVAKVSISNSKVFIDAVEAEQYLKEHFQQSEMFYFEDYIEQHSSIAEISPTAVNTIRVITMINDQQIPEVIGAVFRISVDCPVDNYSAGNLAAEIDIDTGVVVTGGIGKRSSCDQYHITHPITGKEIKGFQIPHWDKVTISALEAAMVFPKVRTVGWDIAVTENGVVFIEGNSQWNKDTWQIPAGRGKIDMIAKYL